MQINISKTAMEMGEASAKFIAEKLRGIIKEKGEARMVVSTGSSQFEMFTALVKEKIEWNKVEIFHLDEYIGLPVTHPASFRKYLYERFVNLLPVKQFHAVDVEGDIKGKISNLSSEIRKKPVDIGLIGIGVNSHIAFNDPPADFKTKEAYIVVKLNDQCKKQQVDEGWFPAIADVPKEAVSMSVWQIMQCKTIVSVVPHKVKADAVRKTFISELSNLVPSSMLKQHNDFHLFIDYESASEVVRF